MSANILLVEVNEDGTVGGSHRALFDLVRHMDRTRYSPHVVFLQDNPYVQALRDLGIPTETWDEIRASEQRRGVLGWRRAIRSAQAVLTRARYIRRGGFDLVHLNNSPTVCYWDWLPGAMLARVPCITHSRGGSWVPRNPLRRRLMRAWDRVIVISQYTRDLVLELGIPDLRIRLVHDGIDLGDLRGRAERSPADVRRELGVEGDSVLCLMVGNIRHWKGQHVVLSALGLLPASIRRRITFAFAGGISDSDRAYHQELQKQAAALGEDTDIRFLGNRGDVPELFRAADIVVHASVEPEPFGLVVPEAMAFGRAVVTSRLGGPGEVIEEGRSGLLFDPARPQELADHLASLINDPELRRLLGEAARERVTHFDVRNTARGVEAVYREVLGGAGAGIPVRSGPAG